MKTFVFLAGVEYTGMKQRPQHMADYLAAKGYRVIYIAIDAQKVITDQEFDDITLNIGKKLWTEQIKPNLYILNRFVKKTGDTDCGTNELLSALENFNGSDETFFLISFPEWVKYLDKLSDSSYIIYDCLDDWEAFVNELEWRTKELVRQERQLAGISKLVITSSKRLYTKMCCLNKNVYYLPNGVNTKDYSRSNVIIPNDIRSIPKPIVIFMGAVAGWVDIELIDFLAWKRPNYSFVIVGPTISQVYPRSNLYCVGQKEYNQLVHYLKQSKVAIIPFKVNKITAAVSPLKFFEYASASLPVVSTMLPELVGVPGATIANDYVEFLQLVDKYIQLENEDYAIVSHIACDVAKQFEWGCMLDCFLEFLEAESTNLERETQKFLAKTIAYYAQYENNLSIKYELMLLYNLIGQYDNSIRNGEELLMAGLEIDKCQLALAYCKSGDYTRAQILLEQYLDENKNLELYKDYVSVFTLTAVSEVAIEAFLLRLCGRFYEALALLDPLVSTNSVEPFLLGMVAEIYFELNENELAFDLFCSAIETANGQPLEKLLSVYIILEAVDYLISTKQFSIAEELAFTLKSYDLEDLMIDKLADIYLCSHVPEEYTPAVGRIGNARQSSSNHCTANRNNTYNKVAEHTPCWLEELNKVQDEIAVLTTNEYYVDKYRTAELGYWRHIAEWLYDDRKRLANCLDIGSAYGTLALYTKRLYNTDVFCTDFVSNYVSEILVNKYNFNFAINNIELDDLPWDNNCFDIIIFTEVLEHLNFSPIVTLRKIAQILTEDGCLYLSTPDAAIHGRVTKYYSSIDDIPQPNRTTVLVDDHVYVYYKHELLDIIDKADLTVEMFARTDQGHFNLKLKRKK